MFGVREGLESDTQMETDEASVGYARESTHTAFDGQTLSGNRPRWQSGYVRLQDKTEATMREIWRKQRIRQTKHTEHLGFLY